MNTEPLRVRVVMPHYFREQPEGSGYGSGRRGQRLARGLALGRALHALLALQRSEQDLVLNIGRRHLDRTPPLSSGGRTLAPLQLELNVFTHGGHALQEILALFTGQIRLHQVELEDPRTLALAARDFLIAAEPAADLHLYLEDDLVIDDPLFVDKQLWFLQRCSHRAVLMPHRQERIPGRGGQRLLVDGPLRDEFIGRFTKPQTQVAKGRFWTGEEVSFDRSANPHSGLFCLDRLQVEQLRGTALPREGFIGPLETAATLTVLRHFDVLKPSLASRQFLRVEHGHPSFTAYASQWSIGGPGPEA
jgi:hypothetical protein